VEQQADNADDTVFEAPRVLAVRWFAAEGPGALAVGPSQSDPRTGEILRGAAIIPENWVRFFRNQATDVEPRLSAAPTLDFAQRYLACTYASDKLEQVAFGHELLSARGAFDPKGPEAERYIAGSLKDVTMHEVGHALGLRHNFRASIGVTPQQLRDPAFTATRGVSNSVMDYNALNMPLRGETVADYHMPTLGTYDYWAIEYGYREFDAADEKAALARLATQSEKDPALAYGTDEDAFGTDPQINHRDLGSDPLAFARREIKLARELWTLTQARELPADSDYTVYRRNLQRGLNNMQSVVGMVAKHVGGAYTSRQLAGAGQPAIAPVPGARQREALDLLVSEVFASSSFRFDPKFMSRLGVNHLDRFGMGRFQVATDFSLAAAVGTIQRSALDTLMSDSLAARLADAEVKVADTRTLLGYAEVQQRLADAAWSELKGSNREIDSLRRNLQREHLRRLAGALVRPASAAAADVRSVHRMVAQKLEADLKRAAAAPGWNDTARAHLAESAQTLAEALRAPLMKQGV